MVQHTTHTLNNTVKQEEYKTIKETYVKYPSSALIPYLRASARFLMAKNSFIFIFVNQHKRGYKMINQLITSKEAAVLLDIADTTLRISRTTGKLFGVATPDYIKLGRNVRYKRETLEQWFAQFEADTCREGI